MSTVANLRTDLLSALAATGLGGQLTNDFVWQIIRPGPNANRWSVEVHIVGVDNVFGANVSIKTVEAQVRIVRRDVAENQNDAWFHQWELFLLDPIFWTDLASVRISPVPEIEITTEPEKIGQVLSIEITARIALET